MRQLALFAKRRSLLRNATLSFMLVAFVTMFAEVTLVVLKYGSSRQNLLITGSEHEADILADYLALSSDGKITLNLPPDIMEPFQSYKQDYGFQAVAENGSVIASSNAEIFQALRFSPSWNVDMSVRKFQRGRDRSLMIMKRVDFAGTSVVVRVTLGRDPAKLRFCLMHDEMLDHVIEPMLPLTLAMLVANIMVLRRCLRPLEVAAGRAETITAKTIGMRLETTHLPSEIVPLVQSFNNALDRLDRAVGFQRDFTASVAHELRTPLTVLKLQLKQHSLAGNDAALTVASEMSHLVNQLLNVAQLEASTTEAHRAVDLATVARSVVIRLAPLAVDRNREIAFENLGAPEIQGNPDAIAAALRNLIENALRATPVGGTVAVTCGPGPRLSVRDHGPGVPESLKDTLFATFTQGDPQGEGAGLGLAIVAKTMDLHGGRAWFENLPDGCAFHLEFAADAA